MAAPGIAAFGDGSHAPGASGLAVQGGGFGAFPGHVWIYQNADRTGSADELTVTAWNGVQATVTIPGSLTNSAGTRYLFLQRSDLAWSNAFAFTLEGATGTGSLTKTLGALTSSAAGALALQAALSATLGNLSRSIAGALEIKATLNVTLGALTSSAIGAQSSTGNVAATLGALTASATGAVSLAGSVSQTLGALTLSSDGSLGAGLAGAASVTLQSVSLTAEGDLALSGAVVVSLGALTLSTRRTLEVPSRRMFKVPARSNRLYRVA